MNIKIYTLRSKKIDINVRLYCFQDIRNMILTFNESICKIIDYEVHIDYNMKDIRKKWVQDIRNNNYHYDPHDGFNYVGNHATFEEFASYIKFYYENCRFLEYQKYFRPYHR